MIEEASDRPSVLIIDDERGPRESLRILLKNEYRVTCADSVDAGVEAMRGERRDVVIMDIRMPKKDGIQGLHEIRRIDEQVSIVMLTGFGSMETAQQALRLGATDYLNKPFDTTEMRQVVLRYAQRTRLERKRVEMLSQLEQMNEALKRDLADKERMAQLGQTSAELIHDLRNPLMIVSGYADLLSSEIRKSKDMMGGEYRRAAEYLDVIQQNVSRCSDLAHMWRKLGRADIAKFNPVRVQQMLDDLKAGIAPLLPGSDVGVAYEGAPGDAKVNGSRAQLLRAFHNVVANAIHAAQKGGKRIRVVCEVAGDQVEIRVEDNGCGMTPDVLRRVFEPYFSTKAQGEGLGLGMAITKRIVEEHQGTIGVSSTPSVGTTVAVRLPVWKAAAVAAPAA